MFPWRNPISFFLLFRFSGRFPNEPGLAVAVSFLHLFEGKWHVF